MRRPLATAVYLSFACVAVGCNESPESAYGTLDEARRAGAIERGWIPAFVSPGARNIREKHDLDTNEVWGVFECQKADPELLQRELRPVSKDFLRGRTIGSGGVSWWPASLRGRLDEEQLAQDGYVFFVSSEGFYLAADWQRGRCYFWYKRSWGMPKENAETAGPDSKP